MDIPRHRALVLRTDSKTPLREMTATLIERFGKRRSVMAGAAYFEGFPVVEAIVDGLFVVQLAVARKAGLVLTSASQMLDEVAPGVDRLVQAGIILVHGSGAAAALAFEERVIKPCFFAESPEWRIYSAKFFAELTRTARETAERWSGEVGALSRLNHGNVRLAGMALSDDLSIANEQTVAWLLPTSACAGRHPDSALGEDNPDRIRSYCKGLSTITDEMAADRDRFDMLTSLPFDLGRLPDDVLAGDELARLARTVNIRHGWMVPALVLAMVDFGANRQFMTIKEWSQAILSRDEWTDDDIVDTVIRYLVQTRRWRIGRWRAEMESFLRMDLIPHFRSISNQIGARLVQEVLMKVSFDALEYTPASALAIAMGEEFDVVQDTQGVDEAERRLHYSLMVVPTMPWEQITLEVFQEIVMRSNIPIDILVLDIDRMPVAIRRACVEWLIGSIHVTEAVVLALQEHSHYKPDLELMVRRPNLVPERSLLSLTGQCFEEANRQARDLVKPRELLVAIQRISLASEFEHLLTAREYRREFSSMVDEWFGRAGPDGYWNMFVAFRDRAIKAKLWNQIVVGIDARMRASNYGPGTISDYTPPWGDYAEGTGLNDPLAILGTDSYDFVADVYANYDEIAAFSWLHEGNPEREKLVDEYRANRKAYYRRHGYTAIDAKTT